MYKVTNNNAFDFAAKFDGVEYVFPRGKTVACEDEPTKFIFGLGNPNKVEVLARYGWAAPWQPASDGMKVLDRFRFEHMQSKYDVPLARSEGHEPALVDRGPVEERNGADESERDATGVKVMSKAMLERAHRAEVTAR
jgi:hypothetical protein